MEVALSRRERKALEVDRISPRFESVEVEVAWRQILRTAPGRGLRIHCLEGRVWVTQSGDGLDHLLEVGESFKPAARGRILVAGVPAGKVRVER
jgi:hypothetical protein